MKKRSTPFSALYRKILFFNLALLVIPLTFMLCQGCHTVGRSVKNRSQEGRDCGYPYPDFPCIIHQTKSAIVNIRVDKHNRGTGFIIHPAGWVITNRHVIKGVKNPEVVLAGEQTLAARVVAQSKEMDIALLKLKATRPLPFLELDDASRPIIGEWVLVLGNPFGLETSAAVGIISATEVTLGSSPLHWIQVDASVNPGNSGGPLINMRGKVAGIVSSRTTMGQGLGFAVPASEVRKFVVPYLPHD